MKKNSTVFALVLLLGSVAWAGANWEAYKGLKTAPTEQVSAEASGDAVTADTPITAHRQATRGNTTVCVEATLSGSAGDTVAITFIPYHIAGDGTVTRLPGLQTTTATAGAYTATDSDNICPGVFFEIPSGATHYEVRKAAPSAGNVSMTWVAYSVDPS